MALAPLSTELNLKIRDIYQMLKSEKTIQDQPEENLMEIIDSAESFKNDLADHLKSVPPMKFKLKGSLGYRNGSVLLAQVEESDNQGYAINRFLSEFSWSAETQKNELINFSLEAKADKLLLEQKSTSFRFKIH